MPLQFLFLFRSPQPFSEEVQERSVRRVSLPAASMRMGLIQSVQSQLGDSPPSAMRMSFVAPVMSTSISTWPLWRTSLAKRGLPGRLELVATGAGGAKDFQSLLARWVDHQAA